MLIAEAEQEFGDQESEQSHAQPGKTRWEEELRKGAKEVGQQTPNISRPGGYSAKQDEWLSELC